jgi:hypothetical protein
MTNYADLFSTVHISNNTKDLNMTCLPTIFQELINYYALYPVKS